jgi:hypothetical protein
MIYIGIIVFAIAPPGIFLLLVVVVFLIGFALPVVNVSSEIIQAGIVPKELLGRIYAVRQTVA